MGSDLCTCLTEQNENNEDIINKNTYDSQKNSATKILYLTKANYKYMAMGIIEIFSNGNWEEALPDIDTVCSSINFQFE